MTSATTTREIEATPLPEDENLLRIGQVMTRMRLMTGRRMIGRLAIQNVAPGLELSHLDVIDAVRRAEGSGEVTVGTIAEILRIDPSRASRIVAEMVTRGVLRRKASQADARRIVVVLTTLGQRLLAEIQAQKFALIESILADWPAEDIAVFSRLFDRFIGGYEHAFQTRLKETAD
ncbi:winged helix-turn-helix transcriptional regulator [Agrobacterium rhizogenes]|uniref:MarR family winged helix-turn-helix transcriptional regulator n=1 Tax=Rhizobium rhizogenes TaxID=359 RepID=UPI00080FEF35|nr:MarR family winged helix-turn-helix transcriptional regulator [Rhizobium rhizogenes]OCJ30292.1 MarR family transcriptional regulator [Agrobacterium sp. B133/95]NTF82881.1 winged helix-turn-helix transcriptional regulator [Rhizobium rhizogenes]NTH13953.1 winged helix-turn-helix transcriptional regulator [Rhizobium rhizogenes]NTI30398.1 winged helix-turn-helix transcriptional regulator [Rhizobium rhizogenes]NTI50332.1 winged helix-turn-helix transcriptional regulator [Rhizobium rhizogenes]